jgi:antitoxin component YwqK of YwqJK toxin-antitoxin module
MPRAIVCVTNDLSTDNRLHRTCTVLQELGYEVLLVGGMRRDRNGGRVDTYGYVQSLISSQSVLGPKTMRSSLLITLLVIWSESILAQRVDTVFKDDPNFPYHVVEMNAKGIPHGVARIYDNNGVVRRTFYNSDGVRHGPDTLFDAEGRMRSVALVEKGSVNGIFRSFDSDGKPAVIREYKKGKPHGLSTFYYPNGQVSMTALFKKGEIHGTSHLYYPNGNVEWVKGYRNGKLHGERVAWDSTGVLMEGEHTFQIVPYHPATFTVMCIGGRPQGEIKLVEPDGRISYIGRYINGLPDGDWIYYEKNGLVDRVDVYRMGKFKETRRTYN